MRKDAAARESGVTPELVSELLSIPDLEGRIGLLRSAGLLNPGGMHGLLDYTERLAPGDPNRAHRLAELCAGAAERAGAPSARPRARYIQVRTLNERGEFEAALRMVREAHDGYAALGREREALRTNLGLMVTLLEQGRYEEALDAGQKILDALEETSGSGLAIESAADATRCASAGRLRASVHQNRGRCLEYMGRYDETLAAYRSAEEGYRSLGMMDSLGEVLDNRGAVLLALGRGTEALADRRAALEIFGGADLPLAYAKALANIGETHLHMGNYVGGLRDLERSHRLLESLGAGADVPLRLRDMGTAFMELNLYSEAVASYREAEDLLRRAGRAHDLARTLWGLGSALSARSEFRASEAALEEAAELFAGADNVPLRSGVMLEQASLMKLRGDPEGALAMASHALYLVSGDDWPLQRAYAHLSLCDLALPDPDEAEAHLLEAQRLLPDVSLPQLRYRLDGRLGHVRSLQGRREEARTLLERAVAGIEASRNTVAQEAMRSSFLRDKTAAYEDLLSLYLDQDECGGESRAFALAEQAKSRALVDLLAGAREAAPDPGESEADTDINALQADLNAIYNRLMGNLGEDGSPFPVRELRSRAAELEREISRLRLRSAAASGSRDPFAPRSSSADLQGCLPPELTMLAYHAVGDEIVAFIVTKERLEAVREVGSVSEVSRLLRRLAGQWERFRTGEDFVQRNMQTLESSARRVLSALYGELFEPLEAWLEDGAGIRSRPDHPRKLVVVPHGPLHQVPFQALFDGGRYLLERFEISYAPSARVFALCQGKALRPPENALVMSLSDDSIPAADEEARTVAGLFPGAERRSGERATLTALKDRAPSSDVLHIACHGMFRSDNPMFSALKLHDGWLKANEAIRLRLEGAIVTLSACESGRQEVCGGDETLGLTRAFLGAGAATLVVSLWLVQDEATGEMMRGWYGRLRGGAGRAAALREAQLEIKSRRPHPYYWAPFVLVGRR